MTVTEAISHLHMVLHKHGDIPLVCITNHDDVFAIHQHFVFETVRPENLPWMCAYMEPIEGDDGPRLTLVKG